MNHLNEEQITDLLIASPQELSTDAGLTAVQTHAAECPECAAEVARLRDSLAFFREASAAFADQKMDRIPAWRPPVQRAVSHYHPAFWAAAAAAVVLVAFAPLQTAYRHAHPDQIQVAADSGKTSSATEIQTASTAQPVSPSEAAAGAQSDEALLDDVNRQLSASLPASLEPLDDPTGTATSSGNTTERTN